MYYYDPDVILTDEDGRPIPRPEREAYDHDPVGYIRAMHDFHNRVADVANRNFDLAFRTAMKKGREEEMAEIKRSRKKRQKGEKKKTVTRTRKHLVQVTKSS